MTSPKSFLDLLAPVADGALMPPVSAYAPKRTPAEMRAESTTQVAREMTDAETERRQGQVAKLRAARLAKEEADRTALALVPKKAARKTKKAP